MCQSCIKADGDPHSTFPSLGGDTSCPLGDKEHTVSVVASLLAAAPAQRVPGRRNGWGEARAARAVPIARADTAMEEGSQESPSSLHPQNGGGPVGAPALCPPPKMGGPQLPVAPCSLPHLTWLLQESPGCSWHPVCSQIPPSRSRWDRAPSHHHGMELGQTPLASARQSFTQLKLQKPAPKIFTSPQTTTSKPPDLEMNHSSAPTRCHYHCHLHCHRCARAPSTSSPPPQRGQDPPMQHQTRKSLLPLPSVVPTIVPTPAAGGDRHSCPPQSCEDTHQH